MKPLKIVVLARQVVDAAQPLPWQADTPDFANAAWIPNPFDEVAVAAAARWRQHLLDQGNLCELVIVSPADATGTMTAERALAQGGDRAILLPAVSPLDGAISATQAAMLEDVVRQERPDVLLLGRMAQGQDQGELAALLAGRLGWPLAMAVRAMSWNGETLDIEQQRTDCVHTAQLRLPAVVSCELDMILPRYVSLPALMAARRKPKSAWISANTAPALPPILAWQRPRPRNEGGARKLASVDELLAVLVDQGGLS